jgi:hypothetical protein
MRRIIITLLLIAVCHGGYVSAQNNTTAIKAKLENYFKNYKPQGAQFSKTAHLKDLEIDDEEETLTVTVNEAFAEQGFTPSIVEGIYQHIQELLPSPYDKYFLKVMTHNYEIQELVPNRLRKRKDEGRRWGDIDYKGEPWVKNLSYPYSITEGLQGRHISLWASHGRYYDNKTGQWKWQRPQLFGTTEDLFTQTIVVPYLIPMLENAGAIVFTPRERVWQREEVIIDNDGSKRNYIEATSHGKWKDTPNAGFAFHDTAYVDNENPFEAGTARMAKTTNSKSRYSLASYQPDFPKTGHYAVYVSYQTLDNSIDNAEYTVWHKGERTVFHVNQQMGGGTWVYLGTFEFDEGEHNYGMVSLSNHSKHKGVVSADAVRFGGGMGNIVPEGHNGRVRPSGLPRWAEAAKYSVQWFGFPYKIHTEPFGDNDYNNDINSRSAAVNYLSGGSVYNPQREDGLKVPLDISVAFHTDAGVKTDDAFVGSLGVYMTDFNEGKTGAGMDRFVSRDLISMFLTNFTTDLKKYRWQVRQLWNRNYGEARAPMPPACILEMLSHQNFADMRMAYDPHFKFDLSRSVYKTIVKYIATLYQRDYVIQPLPVENFAITLNEQKRTATLSWTPVDDPLEPTAKAKEYILYTRRGHQGFDNGVVVKGTSHAVELNPDEVYSFKVTALNEGGESFPSEVLSCGISSQNKGTVLVVNAFTRLEGPKVIDTQTECGFDLDADPGVPYGAYTGFCGRQRYFDRSKAGSEASDGLGMSGMELEGQLMMGNTFDYPVIHGRAIMLTGSHSFTSCSEKALLEGKVKLSDYPIIDLIYGTQKQFESRTNSLVEQYYNNGGKVLMSAANAGCPSIGGTIAGQLSTVNSQLSTLSGCGLTFDIYRGMNPKSYCVPAPSVLAPMGSAIAILTYNNGNCAAIAQQQRFVRLGFPLESITDRKKLNALTKAFLTFLE